MRCQLLTVSVVWIAWPVGNVSFSFWFWSVARRRQDDLVALVITVDLSADIVHVKGHIISLIQIKVGISAVPANISLHGKIHGCRKWGFIIKKSQACEFIYSPVITKCPFIFIVADVEKNGGMVIESSNLRVHFSVHRIEEPLTGGVHTASKHQVLPNNQTQLISNLKWEVISILCGS